MRSLFFPRIFSLDDSIDSNYNVFCVRDHIAEHLELESNSALHTSLDNVQFCEANISIGPSVRSESGYRNQSRMNVAVATMTHICITTEFNYDQCALGRFTSGTTQFKCQRININLRPQNALWVFHESDPSKPVYQ